MTRTPGPAILFCPASRPERFTKAAERADAVILDLEDAVLPAAKDEARRRVVDALGDAPDGPVRIVRVNGTDTPWYAADVEALAGAPVDALMLPKATPVALDHLPDNGVPVVALVETAAGVRSAFEVARHPRVRALAVGGADLGAELGWVAREDQAELLHVRSSVVIDAAAAGVRSPFDVVHLDIRDAAGLRSSCTTARALGLGGKLCIHPAQVDIVNQAFSPTDADVDEAREIVEASSAAELQGTAVAVARGRLVDRPVLLRARATLERAAAYSERSARR